MLRNCQLQGVGIPDCMTLGTEFTKVNASKNGTKLRLLKFDPNLNRITFKSKKLGVIQLEWITAVKRSTEIEEFPNTSLMEKPELRLAIYYCLKQTDKILYLVAPNQQVCEAWWGTLHELIYSATNETAKKINGKGEVDSQIDFWLKQQWAVVDKDKNGKIDCKELKAFLALINIDCSDLDLKVLFKRIDSQGTGYLDFEGTKRLYHVLQSRPEVQKVFISICKENPISGLTQAEFASFLKDIQGEKLTKDEIENLYFKYLGEGETGISKDKILEYLLSSDNIPIKSLEDEPLHDMDQPLSHYWINSSHNTYLTGNQLNSTSSILMYKDALLQGCRCVELDCWDGPNGEPIIYHGYTLTTKILFKEVIETIKENAFKTSPYPVILSLEVHCNLNQQDTMAKHLKNILGDTLVSTRLEDFSVDQTKLRLPSPNQFLHKILLKGKTISPPSTIIPNNDSKKSEGGSTPSPGPEFTNKDYFSEETSPLEDLDNPQDEKKVANKVSKLLSEIVPYCQASKFVSIEHASVNMKYYQMASFSEPSLYSTFESSTNLRKTAQEYLQHNEKCLSRVYPGGLRIQSNNYNPLPFWMNGFQMVALNFQTYDLGMQLNQCFFRSNRNLGYVLKPKFMRSLKTIVPDPQPVKNYLHVKVLSAQNLPKPNGDIYGEIIDPFVEVEMISVEHGTKFRKGAQQAPEPISGVCNMREELVSSNASFDELSHIVIRKSQKTSVVTDNGFNPQWSAHTVFMFSNKEFSYLRFTVHEFNKRTSNSKIASFCIRVSDLKLGYRHLPLYDTNGIRVSLASLFIFTALEEHEDPNILLRCKSGNMPTEIISMSDKDRLSLSDFPEQVKTPVASNELQNGSRIVSNPSVVLRANEPKALSLTR